jgi:hypothetical protein
LIERDNEQLRIARKLEWIKPLIVSRQTGKLAQTLRPDLMMPAFLCWRQFAHSRGRYTSLNSESTSSVESATR